MTRDLPLQDIVEQPAVGWWPLAWGWWLVCGIVLVIILVGWWLFRRRQKFLQPLRQARLELSQCSRVEECNQLLKRVLRHYQPELWQEPIGLHDWLAVLSSQLPVQHRTSFVQQAQAGFNQLYTGQVSQSQWQQAYRASRFWLQHYSPSRRRQHV